jgi:prepilin-type N-terminal cleavage/methylation domain-containing protein
MTGITKKSGFSLLEIVVSVAILAMIILATTQIWQSVNSARNQNVKDQALSGDIQYYLEVFTHEIREAKKNTNTSTPVCSVGAGYTYDYSGGVLHLKNRQGNCVEYSSTVINGITHLTIKRGISGYGTDIITSDQIDISYFNIIVVDNPPLYQPMVTLNVQARSLVNTTSPAINVQTTISSNYYKQ